MLKYSTTILSFLEVFNFGCFLPNTWPCFFLLLLFQIVNQLFDDGNNIATSFSSNTMRIINDFSGLALKIWNGRHNKVHSLVLPHQNTDCQTLFLTSYKPDSGILLYLLMGIMTKWHIACHILKSGYVSVYNNSWTRGEGVKDLPILAQGLPAFSWAGLSAVFFTRRFYGGMAGLSAVFLENRFR